MRTRAIVAIVALSLVACRKQAEVEGPVAPRLGADAPVAPVPAPVQEMKENFSRVHFALDSADLDSSSKAALRDNAAILQKHSGIRLEIQGHCDERGTTDYNLALGDRRAAAVRTYLVSLGVSPDRLTTISYGKERPLQRGHDEVAWSQNRRAEFRITWGDDLAGGTIE